MPIIWIREMIRGVVAETDSDHTWQALMNVKMSVLCPIMAQRVTPLEMCPPTDRVTLISRFGYERMRTTAS